NHVVIDGSAVVGAQWTRSESIGIDSRAERINVSEHFTGSAVQLNSRAAKARDVDEIICQYGMEHRLPTADIANWLGLPICGEVPLLNQLAPFPVQPLFMPDLRVEGIRIVACLEGHENVLAVKQRDLVVR